MAEEVKKKTTTTKKTTNSKKNEESKAENIFVTVLFSVLAVVFAFTVLVILNH